MSGTKPPETWPYTLGFAIHEADLLRVAREHGVRGYDGLFELMRRARLRFADPDIWHSEKVDAQLWWWRNGKDEVVMKTGEGR